METPQAPEVKKNERLSDTEMGNLLSAFGNHEAKAITLVAMSPGIIYTADDLYGRIMELQGGRKGWRIHKKGLFYYCRYSLSPIGLVTQEVIDPNLNTFGYIKSDYGEETGVPLAGLLLKFSEAHPKHSLLDFFAKTGSTSKQVNAEDGSETKKRAPITRFKIFWELATLDTPIRLVDLIKQIGELQNAPGEHIDVLMKNGLISYEARESAKPVSFYKLSPDHPRDLPVKGRHPTLETFIYQALLDNPDKEWTAGSMADLYLEKTEKKIDIKNLMSMTSVVFSVLLEAGYAERGKFSKDKQSEINLTLEQRKTIVDLVTILDGFQNKDPKIIIEGRDFANYLLTHPEAVSKLLLKAKEHSPNANATPIEETEQMVLDVILSSGLPLINKDIRRLLESNYGKLLSSPSISLITNTLSRQGKIVAFTEKGIKSYGPLPDLDPK